MCIRNSGIHLFPTKSADPTLGADGLLAPQCATFERRILVVAMSALLCVSFLFLVPDTPVVARHAGGIAPSATAPDHVGVAPWEPSAFAIAFPGSYIETFLPCKVGLGAWHFAGRLAVKGIRALVQVDMGIRGLFFGCGVTESRHVVPLLHEDRYNDTSGEFDYSPPRILGRRLHDTVGCMNMTSEVISLLLYAAAGALVLGILTSCHQVGLPVWRRVEMPSVPRPAALAEAPLGVASFSLPGIDKPCKHNQDVSLFFEVSWISVYGVFDGHGRQGHVVSNFVADRMRELLVQDVQGLSTDPKTSLRRAFAKVQSILVSDMSDVAWVSGTTATVVVHDRASRSLVIASCGDSGCCMGSFLTNPCGLLGGPAGGVHSCSLMVDHKPGIEGERRRIEEAGGLVVLDRNGSYRVALQPSPGSRPKGILNMSRSLGDLLLHSKAGVSAEPTISEVQLCWEDRLLLLCSDGVWDFVSAHEAVTFASKFTAATAATASRQVVETARSRWLAVNWVGGGPYSDDITALVVFL